MLRFMIAAAALSAPFLAHATAVTGRIEVDNYWMLYSGPTDGSGLALHDPVGGSGVQIGPNTQNPPQYDFTTSNDWLYLVAWSDDAVLQGAAVDLLVDGTRVLQSGFDWEVFATGIDVDGIADAPSAASVTAQIQTANANAGWVDPAVESISTFSSLIGVTAANFPAQDLMWNDSGDSASPNAPFTSGFNHGEYLVFRTSLADASVPEPGAVALIAFAALLPVVRRVRR